MLNINSIEVNKFRSIRNPVSFDFKGSSGLYFVTGENKTNPDLEANGAGKSTLFVEAPFWTITGKTSRNQKAANIHTWNEKGGTTGSLSLTIDDEPYTIVRSWKPNKLQLNGEDVDQSRIDDLFRGITADALKHSIFIPQLSEMFFELIPSKRLELFSSILPELDEWLRHSKTASDKSLVLTKKKDRLTNDLEYCEGQFDNLYEQAESYEKQMDEFDKQTKTDTKAIEKEIAKLQKDRRPYYDQLKTLEAKEQKQEEKQKQIIDDPDIKKVRNKTSAIVAKMDAIEVEITTLNQSQAVLEKEKLTLKKALDDPKCPYCKQSVDKGLINKYCGDLDKESDNLEQEKADKTDQTGKLDKELNQLLDILEEHEHKMDAIKDELQQLDKEKSKLESSISFIDREIQYKEKELQKETDKTNPYEELLNKAVSNLEKLEKEKESLVGQVAETEKQLAAVEYWIKGFKEIRFFVLEDILAHLEMQVNNYIQELGLEGWGVRFDVEKETKSGGVSKGFHVLIKSPESGAEVPWESWSGGEAQRLKLAGSLGLSDLILQSKGLTSNVLVVDEPTTHLSPKGVRDLLDLLRDYAKNNEKQIWLIDHNSISYGGFEGIVNVVKTPKKTEVVFS